MVKAGIATISAIQNVMPREMTPEIEAFCRELDPAGKPAWIDVRPAPGVGPGAGEDFASLKSHVNQQGGRIQFGWVITEHPGWFLEAEFHGVWATPGGELRDILPRPDGSTRILFLPDSHRAFHGESLPNRFRALSRSSDVLAVVQNAEFHARLIADARTQARRSRVTPGVAARNDPCPCGSGLKYKKCCGASAR